MNDLAGKIQDSELEVMRMLWAAEELVASLVSGGQLEGGCKRTIGHVQFQG